MLQVSYYMTVDFYITGTYYCLNMVLITLSSFLNVFVVNMTFFGARAPVPYAIKKVS